MASIQPYRTKKGKRWCFKVDLGPDPKTGKRRTTTKRGFLRKPDAETACEKYLHAIRNGIKIDSDITVKELSEKWVQYYKKSNKRRPQTVHSRQQRMIRFINEFGHLQVRQLTNYELQQFIYRLKDEGLSKSTISSIKITVGMILKYAVKQKIIERDRNPALDLEMPAFPVIVEDQERKIENSYFERQEVDIFLEAAKKLKRTDMYRIFFVLIWTGMRIGELIALRWTDIDFKNHEIHIRRTYAPDTKKENAPKTISSIRSFHIEKEVEDVLHQQHAIISELSLVHHLLKNCNLVFPQLTNMQWRKQIGKQYNQGTIEYWMEKAMEKSGIKKYLTPHKLRHTFTSLAAEAGIPLDDIRAILGHHDDEITRTIYYHVTRNRSKNITDQFGKFMRQN